MSARRLALAATLVAALLALPATAQAKSFALPSADISVRVLSDGSLDVAERITFAYDGIFTGAYRDIPTREGETIDRIAVSENERAYRPGASAALGSYGPPDTFGTEVTSKRARVVWHYSALGGTRTYTIRYRFRGLAVAYDDVVDVNLKVWGSEWKTPLSRLTATMTVPGRAVPARSLLVFGAPEFVKGETVRSRARPAARL